MIELILSFNELIKTYDSESNGQKLKKNYLFFKNKICSDGICNPYDCERQKREYFFVIHNWHDQNQD